MISELIASLSGDKDEESSAGIQKSLELALGKDNPLNIMLKSLPLEIQQARPISHPVQGAGRCFYRLVQTRRARPWYFASA